MVMYIVRRLWLVLRILEIPALLMVLIAFLAVNTREDPHVMPKGVEQISIAGFFGACYFVIIEGMNSLVTWLKERAKRRRANEAYKKYRLSRMVDKQRVIDIIYPFWLKANRDGMLNYREVDSMYYDINHLLNQDNEKS